MSRRIVPVPPEFQQNPFYKQGETAELKEDIDSLKELWKNGYFLSDIASYYNISSETPDPPWNDPEKVTKVASELWKEEGRPQLEALYKVRDKRGARPLIVKYTAMYIQVMHWVSREPVKTLQGMAEAVSAFQYAPLNAAERLQYILSAREQYHAYITLNELYTESGKKWAVFLMKNK